MRASAQRFQGRKAQSRTANFRSLRFAGDAHELKRLRTQGRDAQEQRPTLQPCVRLELPFSGSWVQLRGLDRCLDSLRGSSVKIGTIQRRLAWPLRKDDTRKSRSVDHVLLRMRVAVGRRRFVALSGLLGKRQWGAGASWGASRGLGAAAFWSGGEGRRLG